MSTTNLTPTSYVVLGLVASRGPSTPYELKAEVAGSIGYFWSFPHAQLYSEPQRLAEAGLLAEEREEAGRRRRRFSITAEGRTALRSWLAGPTADSAEIRDPGLLKLFFADLGSPDDVAGLAGEQEAVHERRLSAYRDLDGHLERAGIDDHGRTTLQLGLRYEAVAVAFWREVGNES
ncbi:MAG: PadR family transcriptional regulator [Acidimicrobiales bacterium]